jgi:hypothetical protein
MEKEVGMNDFKNIENINDNGEELDLSPVLFDTINNFLNSLTEEFENDDTENYKMHKSFLNEVYFIIIIF